MVLKDRLALISSGDIEKFFNEIWEAGEVETVLYQDDRPVGKIMAWRDNMDGHIFAVRPTSDPASEYETDQADGIIMVTNMIRDLNNGYIKVEVIPA